MLHHTAFTRLQNKAHGLFLCKVSHAWLWLPSSKGQAGVLPCTHGVQTDQECRA